MSMKLLQIFICLTLLYKCYCINIKQKISLIGIGISFPSSLIGIGLTFTSLTSIPVQARNLPISNDAKGNNRGKVEALIPIVRMAKIIKQAQNDLPNLNNIDNDLKRLPLTEKEFKRLFDEYSENVSYKQKFLDQNAFLVYYTKGFDGPNRPSIESENEQESKEKEQYGCRNDAWISIDDARAEVSYLIQNNSNDIKDLKTLLLNANNSFDQYLQTAPVDDIQAAGQ